MVYLLESGAGCIWRGNPSVYKIPPLTINKSLPVTIWYNIVNVIRNSAYLIIFCGKPLVTNCYYIEDVIL